ncbi:P-loop NTPase [Syntrophotalea acetylenica]|jgi:MinD superfamily P-loop ATPase|nr:P-loop NTPase [Syntrophotalea acetylenica]MDY0262420.1 P-loop NTPase [Syntrophotalea acetylenica]
MIIAVASGKGGTGKTTFSVNLAQALAQKGADVQLLDCDVEEPNDHLFVRPDFSHRSPVQANKPVWNESLCIGCGRCAQACRFNALAFINQKVLLFNELCHACGVCAWVCPVSAFTEQPIEIGRIEAAPDHKPYAFAHGILNIGEAMAPAVIRRLKTLVRPGAITILDASPGTSCPVVETLSGADVAVLVTEPTPFGLNDLKLAVQLALRKGLPTGIVINRSDGTDALIGEYAKQVGVPVLGRIPFNRAYAETYAGGGSLVDAFPEVRGNLLSIYAAIASLAGNTPPPPPADEPLEVSPSSEIPAEMPSTSNFKEITVISGKGGSGKTTVVSSLAMLVENKVLADNDVDAADLHLLLQPTVRQAHEFEGGDKAVIDAQLCIGCGKCAEACHFAAIHPVEKTDSAQGLVFQVDTLGCEGCALCQMVCPVAAVKLAPNVVGTWYVSETPFGPLAHARLGIAEENSGRLVTRVRRTAAELARAGGHDYILGDGPPGTGCPVIASLSGADRILIVTEPTVSGVHDMERVLELAEHFKIAALIVINKADLHAGQAQRIEEIAQQRNARVIARIPFDRQVNDALLAGKTVIEYGRGPAFEAMQQIWNHLKQEL